MTDSTGNRTDRVAELKDRVAKLVDEHWRERSEPLLLSQLGAADHGDVGRFARELAGNLAAFIKDHASDRVQIASGSAHPLVLAAMPVYVDRDDVLVDDLLERARERGAIGGPRFHPAFWAAFRVPLDEGNRRFVSTGKPIRFEDTPSGTGHPTGCVEVERRYIADAECDVGGVQQLIADWLSANELNGVTYLAAPAVSDLPRNDLLGRLLIALDTEDLKRMTIPLDVIRKLRRQAV